MGTGISGRYSGTYGSRIAPGSIDYMKNGDRFSKNINRRTDIDANGFYDIIAHGSDKMIEIEYNGRTVRLDHRSFARLLSYKKETIGKNIRLLSCDTGKSPYGFAQGLAQRLGIDVKAPSSILWARWNGTYFVADSDLNARGESIPNMNKLGRFISYSPIRRKKR